MDQNRSLILAIEAGKVGLAPMIIGGKIVSIDIVTNASPFDNYLVLLEKAQKELISRAGVPADMLGAELSHTSDAFDAVIGQAIVRNEIFFPLCWGFKKHKFVLDTAKVNNKGWYCRKCGCH